ncbi:unnamed protein product [Rotaria sp. Silwood2]|nr:unnamed protein product [Rotaria sp. Silwood2]
MVQILIQQAENSTELILIELQGALEMPVCVIGQHVLDGKMVELDKPLLVMRKRQADGINNTTYQVQCMIKRKLLFHKRSKPIVQYSSKKC